jgi:sugar/nucleoside kinase (ribokinase family)
LANYLAKKPLKECLTRASLLSGYVVTQLGAIPDYPEELKNSIMP